MRLCADLADLAERLRVDRGEVLLDGRALDLADLPSQLYRQLYLRPATSAWLPAPRGEQRAFEVALSGANSGTGAWEKGWTLTGQLDDGRWGARRDGLTVYARDDQFRSDARLAPGVCCRMWVGKEKRRWLAGFYLAMGDADDDGSGDMVRIYWALRREDAVPYIAGITHALNRAGVPFHAKVLCDPGAYVRSDAGLLYLDASWLDRAWPHVAALYRTLSIRRSTPMFTWGVAPGLALAEDPGTGESFGQHRCRLIAEALADPNHSRIDVAVAVGRAFRRAGLSTVQPYLRTRRRVSYRRLRESL